MANEKVRIRLFALLSLPPLVAGLLVFTLTHLHHEQQMRKEQQLFGQFTAKQLSGHIAGYLVERDLVSLNVLAARLTADEPVRFIAVYDDNNNLVAQSGKASRGDASWSADVTFRDSVVGFVRVSVARADAQTGLTLMLLLSGCLAWLIAAWCLAPRIPGWTSHRVTGPAAVACLLVVRIRPAAYLTRHIDKFRRAAQCYGGSVEQTAAEELVIQFETADATFMATCAGLLIRRTAAKLSGRIIFGGTLHSVTDEPGKVRKAASYLAAIAEGELLLAGESAAISGRVQLRPFYHALVDSRQLFTITGLTDQQAIDARAEQLAAAG